MIKVIKNTTIDDIILKDVGITLIASSSLTIHPSQYLVLAASDELETHINDGSIVVNDGNIDFYKSAGIAYLRLEERIRNIVYVNQNPGYGDFSSIAAAVASITIASSTNQFIIMVGPGIYVEPQIVMKPFVSIQGYETQATIITPSDPTNHLIIGAAATLRFCTIKGVTTSGKCGIYSTASGFQLRNCVIRDNPINIKVEGISSLASITADSNIITGVFDTGIWLKNAGAGVSGVFTNSIFNAISANSNAKCSISEGSNVSFIFTSLIASGSISVNCLTVKDGATLKVLADEIKGFAKGIWVENIGAAPIIDVLGANFDSNTVDIQVDHATAIGAFGNCIATRSKISNTSPYIQLSYQDPNYGFVVNNVIDFSGVRNQPQITTTSASTIYLNLNSPMLQICTGSITGQIFNMPDALTITSYGAENGGRRFEFWNISTVIVTVKDFSDNILLTLAQNVRASVLLKTASTQAGIWITAIDNISTTGGTGSIGPLTFTKAGGTSQGNYLSVGQVISDSVGYSINGSHYITKISISNRQVVAAGKSATFRLQKRTGQLTFVDISGTDITIPAGAFSAVVSNLLVPIGPDWEISAYRITPDSGGGSISDTILNVFAINQ